MNHYTNVAARFSRYTDRHKELALISTHPPFALWAGAMAGFAVAAFFPELPSWHGLWLMVAMAISLVRRRQFALVGMLLALAWSGAWGQHLMSERLPESCTSQWFSVEGTIISLPQRTQGHLPTQRFQFEVTRWLDAPSHCAVARDIWVAAYETTPLAAGSSWRMQLRLRPPHGLYNPAGYNRQLWFASHGIDATASVRSGTLTPVRMSVSLAGFVSDLRGQLREHIVALRLEPTVTALLVALAVGDKSLLKGPVSDALRRLGISHLAVISGLHISFAAALGFVLGRMVALIGVGDGKRVGSVLAIIIATAYALLAGMGLPCVRALIMLVVMLVPLMGDVRPRPWQGFAIASIVILLWQPLAIISAGFWLSFGAVAMLLLMARRWRHLPTWQVAVLIQGFVSLLMSGFSLYFFSGMSVIMPLANAVFIPLVSIILVPGVLLASALSLIDMPLADTLWQSLAQLLMPVVIGVTALAQRLPSPWLDASTSLLPLALAMLACCLLLVPGVAGMRWLCLVLVIPLLTPRTTSLPDDVVDVWIFDVGQGLAVLLQSADHTLLYDTGGGDPSGYNMARAVIIPYARHIGLRQLDTLVVSHGDNDHSAGAAAILQTLSPVEAWSSAAEYGKPCVAGEWRFLSTSAGVRARFLWPDKPYPDTLSSNNRSCVLQLHIGDVRLLLPGDIDAKTERSLVRQYGGQLVSDVLVLAHHGSLSSSSYAWLKAVQPSLAIAAAGYANRFGHPHGDVVDRVARAQIKLLNTAYDGAIRLRVRNGQQLSVMAWRRKTWRYWY